jgi:hypothetical protein
MSQKNPVLYSNRLYGTTDYGLNEDAQLFTVTLADSASLSDAGITETITKALADILSFADANRIAGIKELDDTAVLTDTIVRSLRTYLSDAAGLTESDQIHATKIIRDALTILEPVLSKIGTKSLADNLVPSDDSAFQAQKILIDAMTMLDNLIIVFAGKSLNDFIELREWITLTLKRADSWQIVRPTQVALPLYGSTLYASPLYGFMPNVVWNHPRRSTSNFRNENGESHQ